MAEHRRREDEARGQVTGVLGGEVGEPAGQLAGPGRPRLEVPQLAGQGPGVLGPGGESGHAAGDVVGQGEFEVVGPQPRALAQLGQPGQAEGLTTPGAHLGRAARGGDDHQVPPAPQGRLAPARLAPWRSRRSARWPATR